jgi:serine/threonine protein kinase
MSIHSNAVTQAATPEQNKVSAEISSLSNTPIPIGERYELLGVLAKGGMGAIHEAWDLVLERRVAVKFIHEHYADTLNIQRFNDEAMIAGQLQHPNIPPIYDLGQLPDGKPFLAMKLIQGHTLDTLIKRDRNSLHLLSVFEGIAQAVGYAHSRNVIHRDLKPSNVMVGAFGEVQVMDWGLAKLLPREADAPSTDSAVVACQTVPTASQPTSHEGVSPAVSTTEAATATPSRPSRRRTSGTSESHTSVGDIMGTPAYMPPEQAVGDIINVTERSDVFGLGGILCAMLTGQPPFVGDDAETTRRIAAEGRISEAFARLDNCGADSEIVALAKRCLAVSPTERPANGNQVAQMVSTIRAQADQRARTAEIGLAQAATRRRVLSWSASAVVTVLIVGILAAISLANRALQAEARTLRQLQLTIAAEHQTRELLVKTQLAEAAEHAKAVELAATLKLVDERTQLAHDAYGQMVVDIQNLLIARPGTTELRKVLLEKARLGLSKIVDAARTQPKPDRLLVWSHYRMADVEQHLGNTPAALREYRSGVALAERLLDSNGHPSGPSAQQLRDVDYAYQKLGDLALLLGQPKEALHHYQTMYTFEQKLVEAEPQNLGFQRNLGVCHVKLGDVSAMPARLSSITKSSSTTRNNCWSASRRMHNSNAIVPRSNSNSATSRSN